VRQHIVVIGGGFAGIALARALARAPVRITLVDKRNFHLFQPLLYQVATGLLCPSEITTPLRRILRNQHNARVLLGEVIDVDPGQRRVILGDGEIGYDTLVVATGMVTHYHGKEQWEQHAPGLKTLEDTVAIRQRIFTAFEVAERECDPAKREAWLTFAVIGSGATGIELSGMIAEIAQHTLKGEFRAIRPQSATIMLIEAAERILPTYPPGLSSLTQRALVRLGVTPVTQARVVEIDAAGIVVQKPQGTQCIPVRTVLWASGVTASPLGRQLAQRTGAELDRTGRVKVRPDLTVPGQPDIFVIGDLSHCVGKNRQPLPGLAPVATQQGRYVARVIRRRLQGRSGAIKPFAYFDKGTMAAIGRNSAVADIGRWHFGGIVAWLMWLLIHLLLLIQFQNRLIVLVRWAFQYVSHSHGARNLLLNGPLRLPITRSGPEPMASHRSPGADGL
jgi:NADH dehydrogenase